MKAQCHFWHTTERNAEVGAVHPKAVPVILTTTEECDAWMSAPTAEALALQRPLPDGALVVLAMGEKQDPPASALPLPGELPL